MPLSRRRGSEQTAFITGGSSGIGLALARLLAANGANLVLLARNSSRLQQALQEVSNCRQHVQQQFACYQLDVSNAAACQQVIQQAVQEIAPPDIVINSAGTVYPDYFQRVPQERYRLMMAVNMDGIWNMAQAVMPFLINTRGVLVNVSSFAGLLGVFGYSAYCASKYAVVGFSEALRNEMRPRGVHVAVVCPPDTDTPQLQYENEIKPPETAAISGTVKPLRASTVAKAIITGIRRRRFMIIPDFSSRLIWRMKRLTPGIVYALLDATVRRADSYNKTINLPRT